MVRRLLIGKDRLADQTGEIRLATVLREREDPLADLSDLVDEQLGRRLRLTGILDNTDSASGSALCCFSTHISQPASLHASLNGG
jgi:hypothetical protein